jgi:hypothetical protein
MPATYYFIIQTPSAVFFDFPGCPIACEILGWEKHAKWLPFEQTN